MKLYEIAAEKRAILDAIEDNEGELTPEMESALNSVDAKLDSKVENILAFARELELESEAFKKESERLQKLSDVSANKAKSMKEYIRREMQMAGSDKIKTEHFSVSLANTAPSVVIDELERVPPSLLKAAFSMPFELVPEELKNQASLTPDKHAIKELFGEIIWEESPEGEVAFCQEIPGTHLSRRKTLRVR